MTLQGEPVTKKLRVSRNLTFLFKIFVQTGRKKMPKDLKDWSGPEMANLLREDLEEVCTSTLPLQLCNNPLPLCPASPPPPPPPPSTWQEGGLNPFSLAMENAVSEISSIAEHGDVAEIGTLQNNQPVRLRNDAQADALVESLQLSTTKKKLPVFYIIFEVNPACSNPSSPL